MLYMPGSVTILVLETKNVEELLKGRPAKSPDGKVLIAWTPDLPWLAEQIAKAMESGPTDGRTVGNLIDAARTRAENPTK